MNSKDLKTFDITQEKGKVLENYGKNSFGEGCVLARRLVEEGVQFVEVNSYGWDHHKSIYEDFPKKASEIDQGVATLLEDLSQRGMLDSTLVVLTTEFGRTPALDINTGRGHFPQAFSCLLAGGGIRGGRVYGKTSPAGSEVIENKVSVPNFNATIAHTIGLDVTKVVKSPDGRPFKVAHKRKPVLDLF